MIDAVHHRAPDLARFAMREPPFAPSADSRFFYADPARQQCLDMLRHLAEYSEEWLLVTGAEGLGKSSLLNEFVAGGDAHVRLCRIDATTATDGAQLFLQIAQSFGLDLTHFVDGNPLDALRAHLNALHTEQVPVVTVDDAERLSDDALEVVLQLADLQGEHGKLVRAVLFAEPTLETRLAAPRFASLSRPHVMALHAFDEGETARYLVHRMGAAGYQGVNPFDEKAVRQIHRESGGEPARINDAANRFLGSASDEQRATSGNWRRRLLIPSAALIAAVAVAVIVIERGRLTGESSATVAPSSIHRSEAPPNATPPVATIEITPKNGDLPLNTATADPGTVTPAATSEQPVSAPAPEDVVTPPAPPAEDRAAATPPAVEITPAPTSANTAVADGAGWFEAQPADHFTLQLLAATQATTVRKFVRSHPPQLPHAVVESSRDGAPLHILIVGSFDTHRAATAAARNLPNEVKAWPRTFGEIRAAGGARKAVKPGAPQGLDWIRSRDPRHFTVQLVAAEHEAGVWSHLGKDPLPDPKALFVTEREGRSWHVLVYGDFPDRAAALKGIGALPTHLRQPPPWIREFSAIQSTLDTASQPAPSAPPRN